MKFFTVLLSLIFAVNAWASEGGGGLTAGGGGGGVEIDGHTYLYDLFVNGLHLKPYWKHSVVDKELENHFGAVQNLSFLTADESRLLALKIQDILFVDPVLGATVAKAIETLRWSMVDLSLLKTADMVDKTIISKSPEVLPLAVRQGATVYLHSSRWQTMDSANRIGLLIHEAVAALAPVDHPPDGIRTVVAALFDSGFYLSTAFERDQLIRYFPNRIEAGRRLGLRQFGVSRKQILQGGGYKLSTELLAASGTVVFPTVATLSWTDKRSWLEKMKSVEKPAEQMILNQVGAKVDAYDFCNIPGGGYQLSLLTLDYLTVELTWPPVKNEEIQPRFNWGFKSHILFHSFGREKSDKQADCSAADRQAMANMNAWLKTVAIVKGY